MLRRLPGPWRGQRLSDGLGSAAGDPPVFGGRLNADAVLSPVSSGISRRVTATLRSADERDGRAPLDSGSVLVVDDCRIRRDLTEQHMGRSAADVRCAWNIESLCDELDRCRPDVILLNMSCHDADALLHRSTETCGASKVIAWGIREVDETTIVRCVEAGVDGYHLRCQTLDELVATTRTVLDGESACPPMVSAVLLRRVSQLAAERGAPPNDVLLTVREEEVISMLGMGLSNREIAGRLFITEHTVKNHVHNLLTKLGARSRAEAVAIYREYVPRRGSSE